MSWAGRVGRAAKRQRVVTLMEGIEAEDGGPPTEFWLYETERNDDPAGWWDDDLVTSDRLAHEAPFGSERAALLFARRAGWKVRWA